MKKNSLLTWDFKPPKCKAIYCLADEDGRRYVGQTRNLYSRLHQHRHRLDYAFAHPTEWFLYNQKLVRAARDGMHFRAEILRTFDDNASHIEMNFWERYYINKYGGLYLTYNIEPPYGRSLDVNLEGRYVLSPRDAVLVESCSDAESACETLNNITDYISIDNSLLRAMEEIPKGLPSLF